MPAPHPVEFRQRAVELARSGDKPVAALARDLGISESCLRSWIAQADADENGNAARLTSVEKKEVGYPFDRHPLCPYRKIVSWSEQRSAMACPVPARRACRDGRAARVHRAA
jgi:transposase-like protein